MYNLSYIESGIHKVESTQTLNIGVAKLKAMEKSMSIEYPKVVRVFLGVNHILTVKYTGVSNKGANFEISSAITGYFQKICFEDM